MPVLKGHQGPYRCLETAERELEELVRECWSVLDGKYLVVTAFDSGPLALSEDERAAGWRAEADLAFSPRLAPTVKPPHDQFDEWLVFGRPVTANEIGAVDPFVNYSAFTLGDPDARTTGAGPFGVRVLQARFWDWLGRLRPTAYVADGLRLVYVTDDPGDYAIVEAWLTSQER
jgi:hypothetical protein